MATHNGAEFLGAQLASIAGQSRTPIELVVSDDGSQDDSLELVRQFAANAPFDVRILENPVQLGFAENFLRAARMCRGHLIAWSDQDDIWMPEKLARCAHEFESDAVVRLVVHSRQIGERVRYGRRLVRGGPYARSSRVARRRQVFAPASLPLDFAAPGFASVLDRRVLEAGDSLAVNRPGNFGEYGHDTWNAFLAAAMGRTVFLPDVLAYYRQHERNTFGAGTRESAAARVRLSAALQGQEFERRLEERVARATFRADTLRALAGKGDDRGPSMRSAQWLAHGEALQRRLALYRREDLSSKEVARQFLTSVVRLDYGRRRRGGFGVSSFVRDLYGVFHG